MEEAGEGHVISQLLEIETEEKLSCSTAMHVCVRAHVCECVCLQ